MKRIFICIFVCVSALVVVFFVKKRNYEDTMCSLRYTLYWEGFDLLFFHTKNYPESMDEMISLYVENGITEDAITEIFVDPFHRNQDYFYYIPLYHRKNGNREGYLLLSAGIDRKINNMFNDSIYIDEDVQLKLYSASDTSFNIFQKWFGKKDLLIFQRNGREFIKNARYKGIRTLDEITEVATNVRKRPYFVMGEDMVFSHTMFEGKILNKDATSVYFKNGITWFKIQLYDPIDYTRLNVGDDVIFTGLMTGWENDSTINIKNCIPVDESEIIKNE